MPFAQRTQGLPIAIQLAAPFGHDRRLLALAEQIEAAALPCHRGPSFF
jgi:Asp-tRNA(Asn)/Glu-tRNA(Gln) amidotransferase A subunit family amidase